MATREPSAYGIRMHGVEDLDVQIIAGVSTRGLTHLATAAQFVAVYEGRDYVTPEDIHEVFLEVFEHRLFVKPMVLAQNPDFRRALLRKIVERVEAP
jgi:MoxR-like ATPase